MPLRRAGTDSSASPSDESNHNEPATSGRSAPTASPGTVKSVPEYPKFRSSRLPSTYIGAKNVVNPFLNLPKKKGKERQTSTSQASNSSPRANHRSQSNASTQTPRKQPRMQGAHIIVSDSDDESDVPLARQHSRSPDQSRRIQGESSKDAQKRQKGSHEAASNHNDGSAGTSRQSDGQKEQERGPLNGSVRAHGKRKAEAAIHAEGSETSTTSTRKTNTARRSRLPMRLQSDSLGGPSRQQVKRPTFKPLAQRAAEYEQEQRDEARKQDERALRAAAEVAARSPVAKDRERAAKAPHTPTPRRLFNMDEDDDESIVQTPKAASTRAEPSTDDELYDAPPLEENHVTSNAQPDRAISRMPGDDNDAGSASAFDLFFDFGPADNPSAEEVAVEQVTGIQRQARISKESLPAVSEDAAQSHDADQSEDGLEGEGADQKADESVTTKTPASDSNTQAIDAAEQKWLKKLENLRSAQEAQMTSLRTEMQASMDELRRKVLAGE